MLPDYNDITSRISEAPTWYDGHGVPRYGSFDPKSLGVYDIIAVLVEIECQSCARKILVGEGWTDYSFVWGHEEPVKWNLDDVVERYHYGDPPCHGCVGDTMNCIDHRVIEAWDRRLSHEWKRSPDHEIELT